MATPDMKFCPNCGGMGRFDKIAWVSVVEPCIVCAKCGLLLAVEWAYKSIHDDKRDGGAEDGNE